MGRGSVQAARQRARQGCLDGVPHRAKQRRDPGRVFLFLLVSLVFPDPLLLLGSRCFAWLPFALLTEPHRARCSRGSCFFSVTVLLSPWQPGAAFTGPGLASARSHRNSAHAVDLMDLFFLPPSSGAVYEMGWRLRPRRPDVCCYRADRRLAGRPTAGATTPPVSAPPRSPPACARSCHRVRIASVPSAGDRSLLHADPGCNALLAPAATAGNCLLLC